MDTPLKNHPGRSTPHRSQHLQGRHPADLADRRALVKRSAMDGEKTMDTTMEYIIASRFEKISQLCLPGSAGNKPNKKTMSKLDSGN